MASLDRPGEHQEPYHNGRLSIQELLRNSFTLTPSGNVIGLPGPAIHVAAIWPLSMSYYVIGANDKQRLRNMI